MPVISCMAKTVARMLFIFLIALLSGCNTANLSYRIHSEERNTVLYDSDSIVGLSLGRDPSGDNGWVFIGKNFDYLIPGGIDNIEKVLINKELDKSSLAVQAHGEFIISNSNEFSGSVRIVYRQITVSDALKKRLLDLGFDCNSGGRYPCVMSLSALKGKIYKKNQHQDGSKITWFEHPFVIHFYKNAGLSAKRLLYPVAIAADVVTAPVQLIGFGLLYSALSHSGPHR